MSENNLGGKSVVSCQEAIERFVLRARRVEAHSLVRNGYAERYATSELVLRITAAGDMSLESVILPDEEAVESLAARLRPFIVKSEPIYLKNVLDAMMLRCVDGCVSRDIVERIESIREWFDRRYLNKIDAVFSVCVPGEDDDSQPLNLTDALLVESWLYIDAVHADPKGQKAECLKASYLDRYKAAAAYFCEFTLVILRLLDLVRELERDGILRLNSTVWKERVVYAEAADCETGEVVQGEMHVAPAGGQMHFDFVPVDAADTFRKATPALMLGIADPEGRAILSMFDAVGSNVENHCSFRNLLDGRLVFFVEDILRITMSEELLCERERREGSLNFEQMGADAQKTKELLAKMAFPNSGVLQFAYAGRLQRMWIQLPELQDWEPASQLLDFSG